MRGLVRELIETVILALVIFLGLQFTVQNFRVEGSSMEPNLDPGQYLLVNKIVYAHLDPSDLSSILPMVSDGDEGNTVFPFHGPRLGDVIIFKFPKDPSRDFVKRVIGVPGDEVQIKRGQVFLNDEALDEPYITNPGNRSMNRLSVPPDSFFVLGDNRRASNDSRDWGNVPIDNVIGRAWVSYWPLDSLNTLMTFLGR